MATSDMKTISDLDAFNETLNVTACLPIVVEVDNVKTTDKIYYPALKTHINGYSIYGLLTAGSTSVTISSIGPAYDNNTVYSAGAIVTESDKHYVCIAPVSAGNWETNGSSFVEYPLLDSNSTIDVYTKVGDNPYVATPVVSCTLANNEVTLAFTAMASDALVKVKVS